MGSASEWKDKPRTIVERTIKHAMSGGIYD
jgi:hypothetical protein